MRSRSERWPLRRCFAAGSNWICPSVCLVSVIIHSQRKKKAGMVEHPEVFDHAGLLVNGPPGKAGLPLI